MSIATGGPARDRSRRNRHPRESAAPVMVRRPISSISISARSLTSDTSWANGLCTSGCQRKGEYMGRVGDVLQALLSEVDELGRNCSPHMPPCIGGDADSPRWG